MAVVCSWVWVHKPGALSKMIAVLRIHMLCMLPVPACGWSSGKIAYIRWILVGPGLSVDGLQLGP